MEDRLPAAGADVDDHAVVLEACLASGVGDELEHPLRLLGRELADLAEGRHMPLRNHEQVRLGARVDVRDRDEAVSAAHVVTLAVEPAEEAVRRHRRSLPP